MLVAGVDSSTQSTKVVLCQARDGTAIARGRERQLVCVRVLDGQIRRRSPGMGLTGGLWPTEVHQGRFRLAGHDSSQSTAGSALARRVWPVLP